VVCAYSNPEVFGLENVAPDSSLKKCSAQTYYATSGWIEEEFHLLDVANRNGDGGVHKERWRCLGRGCNYCEDKWPLVYGNRFYMEVSPGQWKFSFHDQHKKIENSMCKCGGDVFVRNFTCAGCGKMVLDFTTYCDCGSDQIGIILEEKLAVCDACKKEWSAVYTDHQKLFEESTEPYKCDCGHKGFLNPTRLCSNEACTGVDPYGIFDCQLTIRTMGEGKSKRTMIDGYSIQEPDPRLFDPQFQGGDEWSAKIVAAHTKPIDLNHLLHPRSPDEQAKDIGKPNPFNAAAKGIRYAKYNPDEATGTEEPV
jgi:hypothetical protein